MSLDARYPELDAFLQLSRTRLNRRYLAGEALTAWALAAPLIGVVAGLLPLKGRWFWWMGATAVVSLAFAVLKLRSQLSRHQAASWVDEHAATAGIFRAASECLDAAEPSATARRVLERAQTVSQTLPSPRVPRSWLWRAGAAGLASLAVVAGANLPPNLSRGTAEVAARVAPAQPSPGLAPNDSQPLSPHDTAQRLFPEDARMAALAEQALASGDPGALQSLLQQNGDAKASAAAGGEASSGSKGGSDGSSSGGKPAPGGEPQAGGSTPPAGSSGQKGAGSSKQDSGGTGQKTPGGKAPGTGSGPGSGSSGQGQPSPRSPGQAGSGSGDSSVGSGGAPGQGHSDLSLGPVRRGSSDKTLTLNEPQAQGLYEYVLPGAGAKLPNADVLADSRRAAEAVISRTSPPLEYESTIRDYFLSLSQEVSP